MINRIKKLYAHMEQTNLEVILITLPKHVYYLTGFATEPHERFLGLLLLKGAEPFLIVPALDEEAAKQQSLVTRIYTHTDTDNPYHVLKRLLPETLKQVGIEKNHITLQRCEELMEVLGDVTFVDVAEPLRMLRANKSVEEIERIRIAVRLVEQVLEEGIRKVKPGVTEADIAAELEYLMKKAGAAPAFDTTVLAGEKSALPHGSPGSRVIREGDLLLCDLGVSIDGYLSDMTRTFAVGEVSERAKEIYGVVLDANLQAIEAVRPGTPLADVDKAARNTITGAGYGPYFTHRVGHGLGIEIHEYPSVHGDNPDLLNEGMVITIEPGIYLPGVGGVRIEDDVWVTKDGVEVLNTFTKQLTIIG